MFMEKYVYVTEKYFFLIGHQYLDLKVKNGCVVFFGKQLKKEKGQMRIEMT